MRKTNKGLALVLALAIVLTLFAGIAQASSSTVSVNSVPVTVASAAQITPGRIVIASLGQNVVTPNTTTEVRVTLPVGITWASDPTAAQVTTAGGTVTVGGFARTDGNSTAVFTVANATGATAVTSIDFSGGLIAVGATFTGALDASVLVRNTSAVPSVIWDQTANAIRLANVVATGTTVTAVGAPLDMIREVANQPARNIRIVENIAGTLVSSTLTLAAPVGVTFAAAPFVTSTAAISPDTVAIVTGQTFPNSTVQYTVAAAAGAVTTVDISGIFLNVSSTAALGPINITVSGAGVATTAVAPATIRVQAVTSVDAEITRLLTALHGRFNGTTTNHVRIRERIGTINANRTTIQGLRLELAPKIDSLRILLAALPDDMDDELEETVDEAKDLVEKFDEQIAERNNHEVRILRDITRLSNRPTKSGFDDDDDDNRGNRGNNGRGRGNNKNGSSNDADDDRPRNSRAVEVGQRNMERHVIRGLDQIVSSQVRWIRRLNRMIRSADDFIAELN